MEWLNINVPGTLRSASYIGSKPIDRSTWLSLLGYCVSQENGGVIPDCAGWGDRQWQQLAGVTRAEVKRRCALWSWITGALHVLHYPQEQEETVRRLRKQSKGASAARWGKNGHVPKKSKRDPIGTGPARGGVRYPDRPPGE